MQVIEALHVDRAIPRTLARWHERVRRADRRRRARDAGYRVRQARPGARATHVKPGLARRRARHARLVRRGVALHHIFAPWAA